MSEEKDNSKRTALCGSDEFPEPPPVGMSRRNFIELIGFSAAALAMSGCRAPEQKIIPYLKQPVELTPGVANWYASTCGGCNASCGALVKVRDGRPIKLEGNPEHPLSSGGLCAMAHGMVFGLYDSERLRQPLFKKKPATWQEIDSQIWSQLTAIKQSGGKVRVLTPFIASPTSRETIARFLNQFADGKHVEYQAVSGSAISEAHRRSHGIARAPRARFERARLVVSFDADFLGTWIAPVEFTRGYSEARNLRSGRREMLRHVQFESRLSLTGSNADRRVKVSPAEAIDSLVLLAKLVAGRTSHASLASFDPGRLNSGLREAVEQTAGELLKFGGESLVINGSNDVDAQYLVNQINHAVGSYGKTLDLDAAADQSGATDQQMIDLVQEMNDGEVAALIISGANPAYSYFARDELVNGFGKVPLKVSLNQTLDETSSLADYVCPQHHFLESWNDAEPERGVVSLAQPVIAPLFQTRAYQESLLRWSGDERSFYDVLRERWQATLFPRQKTYSTFDEFWDRSLHDGVFVLDQPASLPPEFNGTETDRAVERLMARSAELARTLSVVLYQKVSLHDGEHANNPWLQELPDPITKVTWDNYACVSPGLAESMQLQEGSIVRLSKGGTSVELPAHVQPGQNDDCVAIALGYGRTKAGKAGNNVGVNAYPLVSFEGGAFQYVSPGVALEKTPNRTELARTQVHDWLEERPIVKEFTLAEYLETENVQGAESEARSIWPGYEYTEHKWGMAIDLNACVGCSACLLSCQAENNVPVVGKDEVWRRREMHWIRLDRYYIGPDDDPRVAFQPVMCSQCDNASCESVCPVLATVHSSEGLNMQVYNRCVGTRYCENNCPYKVRRFNWFEYSHPDPLANLALNPDVTVRTRGVMEKCNFCVQRIEEAKIRARNENRPIKDGDIQPACQQSCPADAIIFGNLVDLKSRVAELKRDKRDYVLLEELNLRPALSYLRKVRNSEEEA